MPRLQSSDNFTVARSRGPWDVSEAYRHVRRREERRDYTCVLEDAAVAAPRAAALALNDEEGVFDLGADRCFARLYAPRSALSRP